MVVVVVVVVVMVVVVVVFLVCGLVSCFGCCSILLPFPAMFHPFVFVHMFQSLPRMSLRMCSCSVAFASVLCAMPSAFSFSAVCGFDCVKPVAISEGSEFVC